MIRIIKLPVVTARALKSDKYFFRILTLNAYPIDDKIIKKAYQ